jgi:hypothetical protein
MNRKVYILIGTLHCESGYKLSVHNTKASAETMMNELEAGIYHYEIIEKQVFTLVEIEDE